MAAINATAASKPRTMGPTISPDPNEIMACRIADCEGPLNNY
jgi:hypothetical protein